MRKIQSGLIIQVGDIVEVPGWYFTKGTKIIYPENDEPKIQGPAIRGKVVSVNYKKGNARVYFSHMNHLVKTISLRRLVRVNLSVY